MIKRILQKLRLLPRRPADKHGSPAASGQRSAHAKPGHPKSGPHRASGHPHPHGAAHPGGARASTKAGHAGSSPEPAGRAAGRPAAPRPGPGRGKPSPAAAGKVRTGPASAPSAAHAHPRPAPPAKPWNPADFQVPPKEGAVRFQDLGLRDELLHAVFDLEFQYCTPVQGQALPPTLAGRDVAARAQTGTGKTAAFLLAIFQRLLNAPPAAARPPGTPRALILAPTRELAMQIERDASALGAHAPLNVLCLFGGEELDRQRRRLRAGPVDVVVATPGRLLDFRARQEVHLGRVEILVIDEADRMLDMGFIPDVRRIVYATPPKERRQTLLFSATLSEPVMRLASSWMRDYVRVDIEPEQVAVDTVRQVLYIVTASEKLPLLYNVLRQAGTERVLLFVNRRDAAEDLAAALKHFGLECGVISGALSQSQRTRTLAAFREGRLRILVATDVAGRGLHIEGVSHVVNYNIPRDPEDYVHRIGRTGRAGATGTSITFACEEESFYLPPIEAYLGRELRGTVPEAALVTLPDGVTLPPRRPRPPRSGPPRGGDGRRGGPRRGPPRRRG